MKKQFTLIELVTVIAILGILTSIIIPNVSSFKGKSITASVNTGIHSVQTAVDMYALDHNGEYPIKAPVTLESPQLIDFNMLYPNYVKSMPKNKGEKYWIDVSGRIWGSTTIAPTVDEHQDQLVWENRPETIGYNVYTVENVPSKGAVTSNYRMKPKFYVSDPAMTFVTYPQKKGETYLVSAVDTYGLETAPVGLKGIPTEMISDENTKNNYVLPLTELGSYVVKVGGQGIAIWDGIEKEEIKPSGTDIKYSFATSNDGKNYTDYESDFSKIEPAVYLKTKIELIGDTAAPTGAVSNAQNGAKPMLKKFKVLFHYTVEEEEEEILVPYYVNIRQMTEPKNVQFNSDRGTVDLINPSQGGSFSYIIPMEDKFILNYGVSTTGEKAFGGSIRFEESANPDQWTPDHSGQTSSPQFLGGAPYVKITIEIPPGGYSGVSGIRLTTSSGKPSIQTIDPEQSYPFPDNGVIKETIKATTQELNAFDIQFDAGEVVTWKSKEILDDQPEGTFIKYTYSTFNNNDGWSKPTEEFTGLLSGQIINIHISLNRVIGSKNTPSFYEISLDYLGSQGLKKKTLTKKGVPAFGLQQAVDQYYLSHSQYPSDIQPTEQAPRLINFTTLGFDKPITSGGVKYWVDSYGIVWYSTVDIPTNITASQDVLSWNSVEEASKYNIYEKLDNGATSALSAKNYKLAGSATNPTFKGVLGKTYVVTALDSQGNETAASAPIFIEKNGSPTAVITLLPDTTVQQGTPLTWKYDLSTDPESDEIVKVEWKVDGVSVTAPPEIMVNIGEHRVALRVQDSKGNWSAWTEQIVTIKPNYTFGGVDLRQFQSVVYVHGDLGSDTTGTGTEEKPYQTLSKAIEAVAANGAIVVKGNVTTATHTYYDFTNKPVSIIGDYLKYGSSITGKFSFRYAAGLKIYNMYLKNSDSATWAEMLVYSTDIEIYNSVFYDASAYSNVYYDSAFKFYNCLVLKIGTVYHKSYFYNTAFAETSVTGSAVMNKYLYNVKYNPSTFELTSMGWENTGKNTDNTPTHIGLYGGPYSWVK